MILGGQGQRLETTGLGSHWGSHTGGAVLAGRRGQGARGRGWSQLTREGLASRALPAALGVFHSIVPLTM